jgi:hypothetical protein
MLLTILVISLLLASFTKECMETETNNLGNTEPEIHASASPHKASASQHKVEKSSR